VEEGKGNLCKLAVSMLKGAIHMFLSCMYSATSVAWNGIRCDALSLEWFMPLMTSSDGSTKNALVRPFTSYAGIVTALGYWRQYLQVGFSKPNGFRFVETIRNLIADESSTYSLTTDIPFRFFLIYLGQAMARVGVLFRSVDISIRNASPDAFEDLLDTAGRINLSLMKAEALSTLTRVNLEAALASDKLAASYAASGGADIPRKGVTFEPPNSKRKGEEEAFLRTNTPRTDTGRGGGRDGGRSGGGRSGGGRGAGKGVAPYTAQFGSAVCFKHLGGVLGHKDHKGGCIEKFCNMQPHQDIPAVLSKDEAKELSTLAAKCKDAALKAFFLEKIKERTG
jgi:uncharacterized membrane protein YgcG